MAKVNATIALLVGLIMTKPIQRKRKAGRPPKA